MKWTEIEIKLCDLIPFERNPRKISKEAFAKLVKSLKEDGYHSRILANQDKKILSGHQRLSALREIGLRSNDYIKVLVPERLLSDDEFIRVNLRSNGSYGEFSSDDLANMGYSLDKLLDYGVPSSIFDDLVKGFDEPKENKGRKEIRCPSCGHEFGGK